MAVKIRLRRMGTNKMPFYRIVVADSRTARDGRFLESLGTYDPLKHPVALSINEDRTLRWMQKGAQPTNTVRQLLSKVGLMRRFADLRAKPQVTASSA